MGKEVFNVFEIDLNSPEYLSIFLEEITEIIESE